MTLPPSPAAGSTSDYASPTASLATLRARVSSVTLSLHQTLDEVMGAFDQHLQELNRLRDSLRQSEQSLKAMAPEVAAVLPMLPELPPLPPQPPASAMPMQASAPAQARPASTAFEQAPKPAAPAPEPAHLSVAALAALAPATAPISPGMMTQVLWPSIPQGHAAKPAPASADSKAAAPAPEDPLLEDATLEELNAALAYAFAQVSNSRPLGMESITKMMPAPIPTSALRFGNSMEASGKY